jgi:hypothetical protein
MEKDEYPLTPEQDLRDEPRYLAEGELFEGASPRVFVTDPDNPEEGRVFVWSKMGWLERIESEETGAVEFSPVAADEEELRRWLAEQGLEATEIDDEFAQMVREEFEEQTPLYPEAPELSVQEPDPLT